MGEENNRYPKYDKERRALTLYETQNLPQNASNFFLAAEGIKGMLVKAEDGASALERVKTIAFRSACGQTTLVHNVEAQCLSSDEKNMGAFLGSGLMQIHANKLTIASFLNSKPFLEQVLYARSVRGTSSDPARIEAMEALHAKVNATSRTTEKEGYHGEDNKHIICHTYSPNPKP